jgi:hypothetical protein
MRLLTIPILFTLTACSRDFPETQIAKCEMEWRSASERVQEAYGSFERNYVIECMSAANYSKDFDDATCNKAIPNDYIMSSCYDRRASLSFAVKRLLK